MQYLLLFCFTCGGNAVKTHKGIKTGGSTRQNSPKAKRHEAALTDVFFCGSSMSMRCTGDTEETGVSSSELRNLRMHDTL